MCGVAADVDVFKKRAKDLIAKQVKREQELELAILQPVEYDKNSLVADLELKPWQLTLVLAAGQIVHIGIQIFFISFHLTLKFATALANAITKIVFHKLSLFVADTARYFFESLASFNLVKDARAVFDVLYSIFSAGFSDLFKADGEIAKALKPIMTLENFVELMASLTFHITAATVTGGASLFLSIVSKIITYGTLFVEFSNACYLFTEAAVQYDEEKSQKTLPAPKPNEPAAVFELPAEDSDVVTLHSFQVANTQLGSPQDL